MDRKVLSGKGWLGVVLSLILCFALAFSVVAPAAAEDAGEGCDSCQTYPVMRPDRETLEEWIEAYNSAPRAYIETEAFQVPSLGVSLSLLSHLQYTPAERNQANCGNCWAWAGTGCLGIALDVQEGIKNRLSVQYINSCKSGDYSCCGGWLEDLADFYNSGSGGTGKCIPWSNANAAWQDGSKSCGQSSDVSCASISKDPNYPITAIQETTIVTQTVNQAAAISNIKNVLGQDKAVWFGFFLPDDTAWNSFFSFWDNNGEGTVYNMDQFCGDSWNIEQGGGHAVLCVGYDDTDPDNSYWIMLNSWGTGPTNNRPSGLFRIDMDMNYDCTCPGLGGGDYAFYWQTLDVTFGDMGAEPDITVDPSSFEVTLPPDTTWDDTLTIGNDGTADLDYDITDVDKGGIAAPAESGELIFKLGSRVLEIPLEGSPSEPENSEESRSGWQNIMTDDFEGAFPGVWDVHAHTGYTDAYWGKDGYRSYSPSYSAFCAKSGSAGVDPPADYPNDMLAWMIYGPFSLADATDAELNFYLWLDSEYTYDYLWCMASINGNNFYGSGLSGTSSGWESKSFDLTDVYTLGDLCGESQVWIAFIFQSDSMVTDYGAFLDDVELRKDVTGGDNNPPNMPSNPSPANHATGVSVDADLSWTGGDPDVGDTVSYDVYLDTTDATTQVSDDQSATTYDPGTLNDDTKYYWKIVATDNQAASTTSPVWDFTTGGADCPWLSESPTSGTVAASGSDEITVSIDTTGLAEGDYSADIVIANNDPDENPKTVPVTLHVSEAPPAEPDITVSPPSFEKTLPPDTSQGYASTIANDGGDTLTYSISDRETTGGGSGSAPPAASLPSPSAPDNSNADKLRPIEEPHVLPGHQEEHVPQQIFEQGDTLEELRDKIEQNGYSFTVDHNWVYDMSPEEKEEFFSRHDSGLPEAIDTSEDIGPLAGHLGRKQLPSQFDWRNYNGHSYIGDIGNQGPCGSCYAFGACAAAEGTYNVANGLYDGNCSDFSESFIIWCLGSLPQYNPHFYGCSGADYSYSELTALTVEGVCSEADFPYQTSCCCGDHWDDPRISLDSWHRIPCGDIDAIKMAIMTYGPVDAAVLVTSAFEAYSGGIYEDSNTACDGEPCDYTTTNHAIALVGWDDNGDPGSNGYWILRNSWGSADWGESGYMRIKYHSAVVACAACYLVYGAGEDCAWLSENPTSGSVAPAGSNEITVTIDTTGLAAGDYSAEIVIDNNDPDENPTVVPVTLHVREGGSTPVTGVTTEVNCDALAGVTITLYDDGEMKSTATSGGSGNYTLAASISETGDYEVVASKSGYKDESQPIDITELGQEYTLDFRGETGLIPNAPDIFYVLGCIDNWLYPPSEECELSLFRVLAVIDAWLYPT